jgi:hypothetical protein
VLPHAQAIDRHRLIALVEALERLYGSRAMKPLRDAAQGDRTQGGPYATVGSLAGSAG